jgi:hypothetical protein
MTISTDMLDSDLAIIHADWDVSIQYEAEVTYSADMQTGVVTRTVNTTTIAAIPSGLDQNSVPGTENKYQVGDMAFRILDTVMPEKPPSQKSVIVYGGSRYQNYDYAISPDGKEWVFYGRRTIS